MRDGLIIFPRSGDLEGGKSRAMTAGSSPDDASHLLVPLTRAAQTFEAEGTGEVGF